MGGCWNVSQRQGGLRFRGLWRGYHHIAVRQKLVPQLTRPNFHSRPISLRRLRLALILRMVELNPASLHAAALISSFGGAVGDEHQGLRSTLER